MYLGDVHTVKNLLRYYVSQFIDTPDDYKKLCKRLAKILLGEHKDYRAAYRWNQPGVIDDYCAKFLGSSETDSTKIMEHCCLMLFDAVAKVAEIAGEDDVKDEEWEWMMEAVFETYTNAFIGLSPATVGAMLPDVVVHNEEQGEETDGTA